MVNPLETLGLQPGAKRRDIEHAYRYLAKRFHPDTCKHLTKEEAERRFIEINGAYRAALLAPTPAPAPRRAEQPRSFDRTLTKSVSWDGAVWSFPDSCWSVSVPLPIGYSHEGVTVRLKFDFPSPPDLPIREASFYLPANTPYGQEFTLMQKETGRKLMVTIWWV